VFNQFNKQHFRLYLALLLKKFIKAREKGLKCPTFEVMKMQIQAGRSLFERLFFPKRDHGHLGWWCCWVGVWGSVNIRKRLAVSSLGTKIHAGEEAAASVLQERKKTRRLASAKSRRYFCLGALYSTSSGLCQRIHAHRRLILGQRG